MGAMTRHWAGRLGWWALLVAVALAPPAGAQTAGGAAAEARPDETLTAVVRVRAKILPDARTSRTLGGQREGSGVLVRDGYVLTIGYLVIEAESIEVTGTDGATVPATLAGYDHASGFGLLRLSAPLAGRPMPLGNSAALEEREPAMVARAGDSDGVRVVYVVSRRPFAGGWEYLLDSAIYTYPPVDHWSGAALVGRNGDLLGIGSLIVADAMSPGTQSPGNMFVPIDLLKPILDDLVTHGRVQGPARPWLGMNTEEVRGRVFVTRVSEGGPAERAGIQPGDIVLAVGAKTVESQRSFYEQVWSVGPAGAAVAMRVLQGAEVRDVNVASIDRQGYFRQNPVY